MVSAFFSQVASQPATFAHIVAMTLLYMWQWNYDVPYERIGVQYDRVVTDGEWWRCIISAYSHASVLHIGFNMWSLWSYGTVETYLGTLTYLRYTFLLLLGSEFLMLLGTWILFRFFRREAQRNTYTVGYSGVVFGWVAAAAILIPQSYDIFGISIPGWLMPFVELVVVSMFVPNASFIGHLSGIAIGFLIGLGVFDWFNNYLFLCAFIWVLIGLLVSLKLTSDYPPLPFIRIPDASDAEPDAPAITIVNGSIVYQNAPLNSAEEAL